MACVRLPRLSGRSLLLLMALYGHHRHHGRAAYSGALADQVEMDRTAAYDLLQTLHTLGFVAGSLEEGSYRELGHKPRRYYQLTEPGIAMAEQILALAGVPRPDPLIDLVADEL